MVGAKEASKAVGICYPRLARPPTYSSFVHGIVKTKYNALAFIFVDKAELDAKYEAQLREQVPQDEAAVQKWLSHVSQ